VCATYASNMVTINSAPCTVKGFDFSLHNGIGLRISGSITNGALVMITNNKFAYGSAFNPVGGALIWSNTGGFINITIKYNHFDGIYSFTDSCSGGCPTAFIVLLSKGNNTIQYNSFFNTNQHDIEPSAPGTFIAEFNYIQRVGLNPSHGDWIESNNKSGNQILTEDHNTGYSGPSGMASHAGAFCYVTNFNNTTAVVTGGCQNDTWVATGSSGSSGVGYLISINPGGIVNDVTISNNYMDDSGSYGYMYNPTQDGSVMNGPITCTGNKSLTTGAKIAGTISTFGAGWICH